MSIQIKENILQYTSEEIRSIHREAARQARLATDDMIQESIENRGTAEYGSCGFAWVIIQDLRGNTRVYKAFEKHAGAHKEYQTRYTVIWSPAKAPTQTIDIHEAGAEAYAKVLREYGFKAYSRSRLD